MPLQQLVQNWWALALRGVVAICFGVVAFGWPTITLTALVFLFGVYAVADGALALGSAVTGGHGRSWWALLMEGLVGVSAGLVTILWPEVTELALLYIIAFWAVLTGVFEIAAAVRLRDEIEGEWMLALGGVLSVLFGVLLVLAPGPGALAVVWMIGAYAILFGASLLALAFRLRDLGRGARVFLRRRGPQTPVG